MGFKFGILPDPIRRPFPPSQQPAKNEVDYVEPTDGSVDLSEVIGREAEVAFLLQDLLGNSKSNCDQFKALGIAGAAGSGKTTVCQMMFNDPQVQERFLPRIWVCMTEQNWDNQDETFTDDDDMPTRQGKDEEIIKKQRRDLVRKITVSERILTCLGEDEGIIKEKRKKCNEDRISGLISLLHRQLVGKRYLIVLDNVCYAGEWYNLGSDYSIQHKPDKRKNFTWVHSTEWGRSLAFGLPKGYGGAVIVNGRSDKLVEMMVGKENLHHLHPLRDNDCWSIFKNATVLKNATVADPERDPQVEELRRFVEQTAGGHPLTAKLMGQCYRDMKTPVEDTAQQAADNSNVYTVDESPIRPANSSDGSSIAQETGPVEAEVPAPQLVDNGNGSSIAQVAEVIAVDSGNGSSIAQVTKPEEAKVTAADSGNGSSIAQVTKPEEAKVTAADSGNGSSIAPVIDPESAEVPAPQQVDSGNGSSMEEFIGPDRTELTSLQSVDSRVVKKVGQNRTQRFRSLRLKFPLGLSRSKTTSF